MRSIGLLIYLAMLVGSASLLHAQEVACDNLESLRTANAIDGTASSLRPHLHSRARARRAELRLRSACQRVSKAGSIEAIAEPGLLELESYASESLSYDLNPTAGPMPSAYSSQSGDGSLVGSFGNGGSVSFRASQVHDQFTDIVELHNGKLLAFGTAYTTTANYGFARLNGDGTLDASFAAQGQLRATGWQVIADGQWNLSYDEPIGFVKRPSGDYLALGWSSAYLDGAYVDSLMIYRFDADGVRDTDFGRQGRLALALPGEDYWFTGISGMSDGRIVLISEASIIRLNQALELDAAFGSNGEVSVRNFIYPISHHLRADGSIMLGGESGNLYRPTVAVLREDGSPDPSFGSNGRRIVSPAGFTGEGIVTTLSPVTGGYVAAVAGEVQGDFDQYWATVVVRFDHSGELDASYGSSGRTMLADMENYWFLSSIATPDGGVLMTGGAESYDEVADEYWETGLVTRLAADGRLIAAFGNDGKLVVNPHDTGAQVLKTLLMSTGRIILVGGAAFDDYDRSYYGSSGFVTAYDMSGALVHGFGRNGLAIVDFGGSTTQVMAVAVASDGRILITGTAGSNAFIGRLLANGSLDDSFGKAGRVMFDGYSATQVPRAIARLSDGRIVVVGTDSFYGCFVALLDEDHAEASAHRSGITIGRQLNQCEDIVVHDDDRIAVVGRIWNSGNFVGITQFSLSGESGWYPTLNADHTFGNQGQVILQGDGASRGRKIVIDRDGRLVVAGIANMTPAQQSGDILIARLVPNGTMDATFGDDGLVVIDTDQTSFQGGLDIDHSGRIVVAARERVDGAVQWTAVLARLLPTGDMDAGFGEGGLARPGLPSESTGLSTFPFDVRVQQDGKPIVGGYSVSPTLHALVARVNEDGTLDTSFGDGGEASLTTRPSGFSYGYRFATTRFGDIIIVGSSSEGTSYRGSIWRLSNSVPTPIEHVDAVVATHFVAYPNPASHGLTIVLDLAQGAEVRIALYDILGRQVQHVHYGMLATGSHRFAMQTSQVAAGAYVLSVETPSGRSSRSITIIR
jgi:uncharacterized delta-60 repeat protein